QGSAARQCEAIHGSDSRAWADQVPGDARHARAGARRLLEGQTTTARGLHDMTAEDLDVIDPPGITARFQGRVIEIKPMPVGKLPAFSRAFRPLLPMIDKFESFSQMDLMELMADHGENLIEAVSIASGISKAELNAAQPVDLIALLAPVLQVNQDFFR